MPTLASHDMRSAGAARSYEAARYRIEDAATCVASRRRLEAKRNGGAPQGQHGSRQTSKLKPAVPSWMDCGITPAPRRSGTLRMLRTLWLRQDQLTRRTWMNTCSLGSAPWRPAKPRADQPKTPGCLLMLACMYISIVYGDNKAL